MSITKLLVACRSFIRSMSAQNASMRSRASLLVMRCDANVKSLSLRLCGRLGYYPNLEWALHKIKDLNISESDADTVDVLLAELEQIDETIRRVAEEVK